MVFIPVILAGGKGERFWPLSRIRRPKQFLSLDGSGNSLLQATADRLLPLAGDWENLWVITASHLVEGIRQQLPQLPDANLLVEPEGRDTAPAVAWTTLEIAKRYNTDAVVGFFPADHAIADEAGFQSTLKAATELAKTEDAIVTLGVKPTYPSTGYGYIEQGTEYGEVSGLSAYRVARFTEKPDEATAKDFLASGRFSWNSGIFVFRAGVTLSELQSYAPTLVSRLSEEGVAAYPTLEKISIDYALMEKTKLAYVLPVDFGWDDLGDWNALERLHEGNTANVEQACHVGRDTQGSILYSSDEEELIVTIGVEDLVVVRDGKATLIVHKSRTQEIKKVLAQLKENPEFRRFL
ncbi:mannose-1-phosphate guanylyltransferase [Baaleninema sp.]|uniref:mannose-1-phosphate guanylyltransferase n=1 Tax=Baaleninema sp. TaxID=3101197 RepID=UPI003D083E73